MLLSGGIGITPVMAMLKTLAHRQVSTPIHFIHAARNSRCHALADEVRHIAAEHSNIHTHFRYDAPLAAGPGPEMLRQRRTRQSRLLERSAAEQRRRILLLRAQAVHGGLVSMVCWTGASPSLKSTSSSLGQSRTFLATGRLSSERQRGPAQALVVLARISLRIGEDFHEATLAPIQLALSSSRLACSAGSGLASIKRPRRSPIR